MKKQFVFSLALILSCSAWFCACDDSSDGGSCSANKCKDSQTLLKCDATTGSVTEEPCTFGCTNNACVVIQGDLCTKSICKDSQTLMRCDTATGKSTEVPCNDGCLNDECVLPQVERCHETKCKDAYTLDLCDLTTGKSSEMQCPAGCLINACIPDSTTKCTKNACKDSSTLLECNTQTGKTNEVDCPYGCKNDACALDNSDKCTNNTCKDNETLIACDTNTGNTSEIKCSLGCQNNACVTKLGSACKTEEDAYCEGNDFIYCSDATGTPIWTKRSCPTGYACSIYDDQALCLEKCEKENTKSSSCGGDNVYGMFQVETVCTKVGDNRFYIQDVDSAVPCDYGCKDSHVCLENECTTADEKCFGKSELTMCTYGMLSRATCAEGKTCVYKSNGQTYCGKTCDPAAKKSKMCWTSDDGKKVAYTEVECLKGEDGHYGYYPTKPIEDCTGKSCDDATGCK